jgi:hypothetical protein
MSIQQLPINGESKIINGVSYVYTAANNSWTVGVSVPYSEEIVYSDSLFISGNGITFSDGSVQTTATTLDVWVRGHANAAFNTVNSTNILAQSAFIQANTGTSLAQSAYTQANTGTTLAQAAFDVANNVSGGTAQDGFARNVANTASANTIYTQGVDATQNTNIIAIDAKAQAAFNAANSASAGGEVIDSYARTTANSKFNSTGGTVSGNVIISNDLTVNGNVSFIGNVTSGTVTGNTGRFFDLAANVLTLTASTASNTSVGYLGVPQSRLSPMTGNYTLVIGDSGEHLYMVPNANTYNVFIPTNASVPFPVGTAIVTVLNAAFTSNVVPTTGVTLRTAGNTSGANIARTLGSYSMASLLKVENDVWFISGAGVT